MYEKATMHVRTSEGHTRQFDVAEGVLQGELSSPIFFALYIADIEDVFKIMETQGVRGININSKTAIHVLAYADDLVILADCATQLQQKLNHLASYCTEKGLTVNVTKTKVLIFNHCHKNTPYNCQFKFDNNTVEIVEEFTYLGVTFCSCGKFHKHMAEVKLKCSSVIGSIISVILRSRTQSWTTAMKLLEALLLSIPLYAVEVWGLQFIEEIEKIQLNFIKRLLTLPQYTPGYMIRLETGLTHISNKILERSLRWWAKSLDLEDHRIPKICMQELLLLNSQTSTSKLSPKQAVWTDQIQDLLAPEAELNLHDVSSDQRYSRIRTAITIAGQQSQEADLDRCNHTSFSLFYNRLKHNPKTEDYLNYKMSFHKKRLFAQLRLHPEQLPTLKLYVNKNKYSFSPKTQCDICNLKDNDDLFHHICLCKIYAPFRTSEKLYALSRRTFHKCFAKYDVNFVHYICKFMQLTLGIRNFCRNE
ncbi:unnamed protein product [Orchesella dallaii]|uniref:Reverse transcriptase domain-containing protein n=1 Tax=Orchesella dallaii TaxID=48710 RepID=A0ABP1PP87_9HEXA